VGKQSNRRILVVDDHADTNLAVAKLLSQKGYDVRTAETCAAAVVAASEGGVDLLLCDLGLPDGDGCDLLRQLRSAYGLDGIAITGAGEPDDINRCIEAGFAAHILKPVQLDRLTATIERVLSRRDQGG
jgi:DNA-binding response OmpR family regulator